MFKSDFILSLLLVFIFHTTSNADTLYLKNGRSIEGLVGKEDEEYIELEVSQGIVKLKRSEVGEVKKASPEEAKAIRQKWEAQKIETRDKILRQKLEDERKPKKVEFSQDNQGIMLDVTLNKKIQARLVLDTGASIVMLRRHIAEKLGINLDRVMADMTVQLADGRQVKAKHIFLESVEVQNVKADNVEASILLDDEGGFADGLLGMSFLKRFNFKVDQKDKRLILEKF